VDHVGRPWIIDRWYSLRTFAHPRVCRHSFAISPRIFARVGLRISLPSDQRAQGIPGARCTRGPVSKVHKKTPTSIQVQPTGRANARPMTGSANPAFPAQWFYGLFRALPSDQALGCHRRPRSLART
jgi:hypothetical protein